MTRVRLKSKNPPTQTDAVPAIEPGSQTGFWKQVASGVQSFGFDQAAALLALAVLLAFWPGIILYAVAPKWAVIAVGAPALLFFRNITITPLHRLGGVILVYSAVTILWAPVFVEAADGWIKLLILGLSFCVGAEIKDMRPFYKALSVGITVSAVLACLHLFGISLVEQTQPPAGLFANKNPMGEIAALGVVATLASGMWLWAIGPLVALAVSQCWGAWLGVAAAGWIMLWSRTRIWAAVSLLLVFLVPFVPTSFDKFRALESREEIWLDAVENLRWFGHGIGTYWVATPEHAPRQIAHQVRHWHAHNDLLEWTFELGVGALLVALFIVNCLFIPQETERLVLITFLATGMVGFPLHMPATAFVAAVVAGRLAGGWPLLQRPLAKRANGSETWPAWQRPFRAAIKLFA